MITWKDRLITLKNAKNDHLNQLILILQDCNDLKREEVSEFYKFLTGTIKMYPDALEIVIKRILEDWQRSPKAFVLFKSTVSFLARLKSTLRRQEFKSKISKLWPIIFEYPGENRLKLFLVREYRRELSFDWLLEFVMRDENEFFYAVDFGAQELDYAARAAIDILMELLGKAKKKSVPENDNFIDELRVSGILEKIGSLWRSPSFNNPDGLILKLLALASSISGASNTIFDSLPGLLDTFLSEGWCNSENIWQFRLVDSIIQRFPKKQYVLSQSRQELAQVSIQIVRISTKSLDYVLKDAEYSKTITGLIKSVLDRWEDLTDCPGEVELEFSEKIRWFLDESYKRLVTDSDSLGFNLLSVLSRGFIECFAPLLLLLFRNALKLSVLDSSGLDCLNLITKHLVNDGGTDRSFRYLFKEYPSLISDVYTLINKIDTENCSYLWLLMLVESSRTRRVLIDFLINPEQIKMVKNDTFWIEFVGRLVESDDLWTGNNTNLNVSKEFLSRAQRIETSLAQVQMQQVSHYFLVLLKHFINCHENKLIEPESVQFILKHSKQNLEMLSLVLSYEIDVLKYLKDLHPFENVEIAKKVYNTVKGRLCDPKVLVNRIFSADLDALVQWNLHIESDNLTFKPDEAFEVDHQPAKDYGNYLNNLFCELVNNTASLIKETDDSIEMYLEYHKYGQIRSMALMQETLLSRYRCSELLLRIPLTILRTSGKEFGSIVLDDLLVKGWRQEDLDIIKELSVECDFGDLIAYYQDRLV